jgi:hypothetical protein
MHKLPADFDQTVFSGCYLEMICFGSSIIKLDFSRAQNGPGKAYRISCVLEGMVSFMCDGVAGVRDLERPASIIPLLGLLMRDVSDIKVVGNASLQIMFKPDGYIVLDGDNSPGFESYSIYSNSGDVINI